MCGIAGIFYNQNKREDTSILINRMIHIQSHRGPDARGQYLDEYIALGHCRLAIIDLSPAAHQPLTNEDETIWLVFCGEIYNYLELIPELKARGHKFKSRTDSEVIIHSYEDYGEDCVKKFNGMWGFALWDKKRERLFLSRDRLGVKPLYYFLGKGIFYFASEIKAILEVVPEARKPNLPYLYHFLPSGSLDDGEETFFEGIKSLPPAHYLIIDRAGNLRFGEYWSFDSERVKANYDYTQPEETFFYLLSDAVRLRLRSDVPVGTCLSGGLDSSSIVALSTQMLGNPLKTFSVLYEERDCDESYYIKIINERFRTDPYPTYPKGENLFNILPKIVWHQDEPTAGPGLYSQWHVMERAKGEVKVLLDGQGGDELLGGYFPYFSYYLSSLLKSFFKSWKPSYLVSYWRDYKAIKELTSEAYLSRQLLQFAPRILRRTIFRSEDLIRRLNFKTLHVYPSVFHPEFIQAVKDQIIIRDYPPLFKDDLNNILYWHLTRQSLPALLHYEDRNSMAFSIEARTPFLDYRLVEFCLGLPYDLKIKGATTKYILRRAMRNILPIEIVERKDKKGYPTPMAKWFREEQKEKIKEILFSKEVEDRRIFNLPGLKVRVNKHLNGEIDTSWEIYRWLTTELWFRIFIDQSLKVY